MFDSYQFDLANVLVGILVGFVAAFLIRLSALKSLDLKLNKIGMDLGIEGFEPQGQSGVRIGDIAGQVHGDIVGRDKSVSNFFDKLQTSMQRVLGSRTGIRQRRTRRFQWQSDDPNFTLRLNAISRSYRDNWTQEWIDLCLSHTSCKQRIYEEIQKCRAEGWEPVFIDFDNHGSGIHVNLDVERELV